MHPVRLTCMSLILMTFIYSRRAPPNQSPRHSLRLLVVTDSQVSQSLRRTLIHSKTLVNSSRPSIPTIFLA
jgi:hypothetical protein